jgi:hypothetical protein
VGPRDELVAGVVGKEIGERRQEEGNTKQETGIGSRE